MKLIVWNYGEYLNDEVNNIYIENDLYPNGVYGKNTPPDISEDYIYLEYDDSDLNTKFFTNVNNETRPLTDEQLSYLHDLTFNWVQPEGQEGNLTLNQIKENKIIELRMDYENSRIIYPVNERESWIYQETEANNYIIDNNVKTPFIDNLLVSRDLDETKDELITKILEKASDYKIMESSALGKYQKLLKDVEVCVNKEDVELISWN